MQIAIMQEPIEGLDVPVETVQVLTQDVVDTELLPYVEETLLRNLEKDQGWVLISVDGKVAGSLLRCGACKEAGHYQLTLNDGTFRTYKILKWQEGANDFILTDCVTLTYPVDLPKKKKKSE